VKLGEIRNPCRSGPDLRSPVANGIRRRPTVPELRRKRVMVLKKNRSAPAIKTFGKVVNREENAAIDLGK